MVDQKKQAVSIRLGESDIRNIKRMARRLGVRDSDIIRYAIKTMLSRMSPLCDAEIRGRNLVPVLVESGEWTGEECVGAQRKMAAFAAMHIARVITAMAVNPGRCAIMRAA